MDPERAAVVQRHLELLASVGENIKLVKHLKAESFKLKSELEQISALQKRVEEMYQNMKEAPVILLAEYREVKRMIPLNQKHIANRKTALATHLATITSAEKLIVSDQAELKQLEATIRSWGRVVPFKRNDKR